MGSFLNSCAITNISIQEKSLVYITPVVKNTGYHICKFKETEEVAYQEYSSPCYPNAFWKPLGMGIVAQMNDCGNMTPVDDEMNRLSLLIFFRYLKNNALTTLKGKNPYHELEVDFKSVWEKSKLSKIKDFSDKMYRIPFTEYLNLWNYTQEREDSNRIFQPNRVFGGIVPIKFSVCLYEAFYKLATMFDEDLIDSNIERKKDNFNLKCKNAEMMEYFRTSMLYDIVAPPSGRQICCDYTSYLVKKHRKLNLLKNKKDLQKLKEDMVEILLFWKFQYAMQAMYLTFNLDTYAGQDYDNQIGTDYSKFVREVNKEYNEWIEEDNVY